MTQPPTVLRADTEPGDSKDLESEVRSYSRMWPAVFDRAAGDRLYSVDGQAYLDFFMGASALNYGHNNPELRGPLIEYLERGGVMHSLDMMTKARQTFLRALGELVLTPRALDYKVQFTGPTGANAVEAALKIARRATGRRTVAAFSGAFHGMSLGALSVTTNHTARAASGVPLEHVLRLPFPGFGRHGISGLDLLEGYVEQPGSGVEKPAAVIIETVQGEGGVNVADGAWLRRLSELCTRSGILLIVDDIQAGCGRTGRFFSFEDAGIVPDIVCLSKSLSGYGLPLSLTLFRRDLDIWRPGQHNGTFRGSNAAFITATATLRTYWSDDRLSRSTQRKGAIVEAHLDELCRAYPSMGATHRGRGLMHGLHFPDPGVAQKVSRAAFDRGLLLETAGPCDEVVKLLPSLLISERDLNEGLHILGDAITGAVAAPL
ncbi:diaminobutyrate--2-oxoglutarate transaminase [Streptomyces sp. NPDC057638]|uniref:diaminobutyrate--2-oxoglutarate transaminase n=1 Tax=Streptomyces sp. NPDC057638 TaxID=3346190 RepID=UPI003697E5D3